MVHWTKSHQVLHTLLGLASLALTVYGGWTAFQARRQTLVTSPHPIIGLICTFSAVMLTIGGLIALITRQCCMMDWQTPKVLMLGRIHKYFAYLVILLT